MAFGLGACKENKETKAPEVPTKVDEMVAKVTEAVAPVLPKVAGPKISPTERGAKLGFAKHLPQDTEVVLAFYNGSKTADRLKASKLWKLVESQMNGGGMSGPDEEMDNGAAAPGGAPAVEGDAEEPAPADGAEEHQAVEEAEAGAAEANPIMKDPAADDTAGADHAVDMPEPVGPAVLLGTEVTLAFGKTTGEQTGNLLTLNRRMSYFQMRGIAKAFAAAAKSGDMSSLSESFANSYGEQLMKDLAHDPESGMGLFDKMNVPPIYIAFRTKESDRAGAARLIASTVENVSMMGEMVEPVTFESGGFKFEGAKILGSKISAMLAEDREEMDKELDTATVDKMLAAIAKKNVVVASGTVGEYVVMFVGASTDDLKLAADADHSLVGSDALAFSDAYASKDLAALAYGKKEMLELLVKSAGGLADMTNGIRDGLAGADGLGNTRDLEALFGILSDREAALRKLATTEGMGLVAYFEDGLKMESFGGTDNTMLDWKTPNKLSHIGDADDVLFFANATVDANFDEKARAYAEAMVETAYAITMKVSEAPLTDEKAAEFKGMAKMFDEKFRPDLVALWDAYADGFNASLGHERAVVVDLNGAAPAIPGLPQPIVDKAKVPRIALVAPVIDRAKLSGSWEKMNTTLTSVLAKVSEMAGKEIPMQKPLSSEKNGNTTWFFPMPFFNDDFLPSVTVGDKWFAASSSKMQALDLIAKADKGGEGRTGFYLNLNFKALETYAKNTYKLYDENAAALNPNGEMSPADKKVIEESIAVLGDLDRLTIHTRRENSQLRSSVHFKTR